MSKPLLGVMLPDIRGTVIGCWTVGERRPRTKSGHSKLWAATCNDCALEVSLIGTDVRNGVVQKCRRCTTKEPKIATKRGHPLPAIGTVIGDRTVIGNRLFKSPDNSVRWRTVLICKCGLESLAVPGALAGGRLRACRDCCKKNRAKPKAPRVPRVRKPPKPKEPKPARPMKLAAVKPPKPKAMQKVPMTAVPLPTEWNSKTILDLIVRREALRQEWVEQ